MEHDMDELQLATDIITRRAVAVIGEEAVPIPRRTPDRYRARYRGWDPYRRRFVRLDRPADGYCRYTLTGRAHASSSRTHKLAIYLPYGEWTCADGRVVLFNRFYEPIVARAADGVVSIPDPAEWVPWVAQRWLFNDGNPPWRNKETLTRCEAILRDFGVEP
jgi:transposase